MTISKSVIAAMALIATVPLSGCGDEADDAPETFLPNRPEDKLIEGTGRPERVVEDPTPPAGTSGPIPGYDPTEPVDRDDSQRSDTLD